MPPKPAQSSHLQLEDLEITLIRSRRRTLTLEVDARGIRVRAPNSMPQKTIRAFVHSRAQWLRRQLARLPEPYPDLVFEDGASIPYRGGELALRVWDGRGQIRHDDNTLTVPIVASHLPKQESVRRKVLGWYRQSAIDLLQQQVGTLAPSMLTEPACPDVRVREYRRRWGSCDHQGNLSFNWRLVQAPDRILRYVVVHELAHRIEFNHSKKFWQIVESHDPCWRQHRQWLNEYGGSLYRC